MKKILIVCATLFEAERLLKYFSFEKKNEKEYAMIINNSTVKVLITSPGIYATAFLMGKHLATESYDIVINIGIAGAFNKNLQLGEVVEVREDYFADIGIEHQDGSLTSLFQEHLMEPNTFPFTNGLLKPQTNHIKAIKTIKKVIAATVNQTHGNETSIQKFLQHTHTKPDIETMEGAAFFYACMFEHTKCLQIRSVSNYVEKRDKNKWDIGLAIKNLNTFAVNLMEELSENYADIL